MPTLQYFDIKDSKVKIVNEEESPEKKISALEDENSDLWYENMVLEKRIVDETSSIWYELMLGEIK